MNHEQYNTARTTADAQIEGRMKADMGKAKRKILKKKMKECMMDGKGGCHGKKMM
jgi:hypothetical protein